MFDDKSILVANLTEASIARRLISGGARSSDLSKRCPEIAKARDKALEALREYRETVESLLMAHG